MTDTQSHVWYDFWPTVREKIRLQKQVKILRRHLNQIAQEPCSYAMHEGYPNVYDPDCAGAECWAKKGLKESRAVKWS